MAALNKVASYFADEIRDGIAWVIIWKTDRSWHGYAAWLDPDTETFEPDDLEKAIAQEVVKTVQPAIDYAAQKAREFIDWAIQVAGEFAKIAAESLSKFMDAMLYSVNAHPKWWHLYKHAKKYRVRKKYRKRLMQQLIESLRAAPDPLEVIT